MPRFLSLSLLTALIVPVLCCGAEKVPPLEQRAAWFQHDRFGLFIHFGVFSQIGKGEWIRESAHIPLHEYNKLQPQFNPAGFTPRSGWGWPSKPGKSISC